MFNEEQKKVVAEIIKGGDSAESRLAVVLMLSCHAREKIMQGGKYGEFGEINFTSIINVITSDWKIIVESLQKL